MAQIVSRGLAALSVAAGLGGLAACSSLTDVAPPTNLVDNGQVATQASAVAMYQGAISNFAVAYGGSSTDASFVVTSGLFGDEYTTNLSGGYATRDTHNRTPALEDGQGPYEPLHGVRRSADEAIKYLTLYGGTAPKSYVGEMHALKGYVYLLLSELYCEGVPFGTLDTKGLVVDGTPETRVEMNTHAIAQFDSAIAIAADSARILQLAAVGKGRAYLNLGDFANAKAAVASVPTSFSYMLTYGTGYATGNFMQGPLSYPYYFMSDREGTNGLDYKTTPDVRMAKVMSVGQAFSAKFPTAASPIPLATGIEARLIEAEVALHDNDIPTWRTALNTLRASASTPAIAALTADSTTTASDTLRVNVMFRERAFWMYGTGHRAGDMRRLIRQYQRAPGTVFPVGVLSVYGTSLAYVTTPVIDIPMAESVNNPKSHGCLNHDA